MSSHHIVRENQEPALVIINEIHSEILNQLFEWSPKIFCHHSLLEWVKDIQIKVDVVFGPSSEKDATIHALEYQFPVEYIEIESSDELCSFLETIDNHSLHLIVKEPDQLKYNSDKKDVVYINDSYKAFFFQGKWQKWKNKGDIIELSGSPEFLENLTPENNSYTVNENGKVIIRSTDRMFIKEFY